MPGTIDGSNLNQERASEGRHIVELPNAYIVRGKAGTSDREPPAEFRAIRDQFMMQAFQFARELSQASGLSEPQAAEMVQQLMLRFSEAVVEAEIAVLQTAESP